MLSEAVALENDNKVGFYYLDKKKSAIIIDEVRAPIAQPTQ